MADNDIIKKIKNEILFHLNEYENKDFEVLNYNHLKQHNNTFLVQVGMIFQKYSIDPFTFSITLQYIEGGSIEKDIKLSKDIDKRGKIIFEFFEYFEKLDDNLILQYCKRF